MARTVMVMAGGTGGHIYPGLAVAGEMAQQGWKVVWLGGHHGMETRIVPPFGYDMVRLSIGGLRGKGVLRKVVFVGILVRATVQALRAIRHFKPDVVLGMGGYPSFPGGLVSALLRIPLVIHEQNAVAGLSNRVLACLAQKVLTGFPSAFTHPNDAPLLCKNKPTQWLGNPVRKEISAAASIDKTGRSGPLRLLVVGGSLGAAALNAVVPRALARIPVAVRPEVIHQAGGQHVEGLRTLYAEVGVVADVRDFITDMADMYGWCDVAITRAGALTLAELAAAGVPAFLVPYPHAVDDHQTLNAQFLVGQGAAKLLPQPELGDKMLADHLMALDRHELHHMAQRARQVAKPDATVAVAQQCREAAK
jgi:UDP-N-acetylglucosamine--N-acetylmuramyl-(pentapeptide) pyrophosphoryl-undecaprenol N-acetylglucosamine transferase